MALLSYTTEVSWKKSVGEIVTLLADAKVCAVMQEYDGAGNVVAIAFRARGEFGEMPFRLPCDVPKCQQVLVNQCRAGKVPRRFANDSNHARNVAWRILRHWIEAQMALIEIGMVRVEQVFLPYAQNSTGATFYEAMRENRFAGLALTEIAESHP